MKIKALVIDSFARTFLGSNLFGRIKGVVERKNDLDIPGSEKKAAVIEEIRVLGLEISEWAMQLAIELAVSYFKTKSGIDISGKA